MVTGVVAACVVVLVGASILLAVVDARVGASLTPAVMTLPRQKPVKT